MDKGGPDGGDGGRGGDVWLSATTNQASLLGFRDHPHRRATDGGHGSGKRRHGARGPDLVVPVPVGTVVRDRDGSVLCDLAGAGDRWLAAEGGRGGQGNARFLSNKRRAPAFAEQGEKGQERWLGIELKLAADVALVGFPNVGKSTLIAAVSAAKPKVADYPFTTLQPHLGVVRVGGRPGRAGDDEVEFVMADVPGLVEGAAEGRGLGHRFLRHVERSRVLLVLLDLAAPDGRAPADQLAVLLGELARYQPDLIERPRLVVGSRADLDPTGAVAAGAGLGVAQWASRLASAAQPAQLAAQDYSILDWRVVGFAVGLAATTGPDPTPRRTLGGLEFSRHPRPALVQVLGQPVRRDLLPAAALHQRIAQDLSVLQRLTRLVLQQIGTEDQIVSREADPILLAVEQLARPQLVEGVDDPPICMGTLRTHLDSIIAKTLTLTHVLGSRAVCL